MRIGSLAGILCLASLASCASFLVSSLRSVVAGAAFAAAPTTGFVLGWVLVGGDGEVVVLGWGRGGSPLHGSVSSLRSVAALLRFAARA